MCRIFACLAGMAVALFLGGCGGKVPAPKGYKTWNATDGTFSIQYQDDWNGDGGGRQGFQWAVFSRGSAKITIDVSTEPSLIGDIAQSFNTAAGLNQPLADVDPKVQEEAAPVAAAHAYSLQRYPVDLANYKEKEPVAFQTGFGDARKSEFTARAGLGAKLHGYRATTLTVNKAILIFCQCPDSNWQTLQPAFDKVLESIKYSSGP